MAYKTKYTVPDFTDNKPIPREEIKHTGELVDTDTFLRQSFLFDRVDFQTPKHRKDGK